MSDALATPSNAPDKVDFLSDIARLRALMEEDYCSIGDVNASPNIPLLMHAARMQVALQAECEAAESARVALELQCRSS